MATQLKHTDIRPIPVPASEAFRGLAPRPHVRVAFSAGPAFVAVRETLAANPDAHKTLEELTVADLARGVIATAHELLSPRMFTAFLAWGETASCLSTHYDTDEEGNERSSRSSEAIRALAALPIVTEHDLAIKQYLMLLDATDSPCCGPLRVDDDGETYDLSHLIRGLNSDLVPSSPLTQQIDQLARTAWEFSGVLLAWSLPIGGAITSAFSEARGIDSTARERGEQRPLDLSAYDMWMRGPLIAWNRQYDRYLAAAEELATYDRDVHTPMCEAEDGPENGDDDPYGDAVQARYDELLDAMTDELDWLLALPAPGAGELATKLKLWRQHDGHIHRNAGEVVDKLTIDARRFAKHGAHLLTDKPLLNAFASRQDATRALRDPLDDRDRAEADVTAAEAIIFSERATTVEGVVAKLRIIFLHISDWDWSDRSITNPKHRDFIEGLSQAGGNDQALWSVIEDLARIGGVDLAEQGL